MPQDARNPLLPDDEQSPSTDPTSGTTSSPEANERFVVTPGLLPEILRFIEHLKVVQGEPVMVIGPTGVGKSLFLILAEKLHRKEQPKAPVVWANCAHFGGRQSDPNIARSELFGVIAGFLKKNSRRTKGLVEEAADGLLVLEEIGELPLEVQAMLLTFIETGEYRAVGSGQTKKAKCRIVGATNREEELREDFRYRFFPFYVPAIHERRHDILYYLGYKFPNLIPGLRPFEVLALLAYNWPGNVREIERIGRLLQLEDILRRKGKGTVHKLTDTDPSMLVFDLRETSLNIARLDNIYYRLKRHDNKHFNLLRRILIEFGIDFKRTKNKFPFSNFFNDTTAFRNINLVYDRHKVIVQDVNSDQIKIDFGLHVLKRYTPFKNAHDGLKYYCHYLLQSIVDSKDLLDIATGNPHPFRWNFIVSSPEKLNERHAIEISILKLLTDVKLSNTTGPIPYDSIEFQTYFTSLNLMHPSNKFMESLLVEKLSPGRNDNQPDITSMGWDDLLRYYISKLLDETNGSMKEAADRAGVNYQTFISRVKKYQPTLKSDNAQEGELAKPT